MTREEARKLLGEDATEEQVTNLLNEWHLRENAKVKELEDKNKSLTDEISKYSDYAELKKQLDDINKAKMTEQEKLDLMKKETEQNLSKSKIIYNTAVAKRILAGLDFDDEDIAMLVTEDETTTINRANRLKAKFDSQKENVVKETKESLTSLNLDPTLPNVNQNNVMTLEKFGNMSAEEQNKWMQENPNGLENLN